MTLQVLSLTLCVFRLFALSRPYRVAGKQKECA